MDFILASQSPRRQKILTQLGYKFEIAPSHIDETVPADIVNDDVPEYLAKIKALDISEKHPKHYVLAYDTLVFYNNQILGKPSDKDDAKRILSLLSGKEHYVITGVCLVKDKKVIVNASEKTQVNFRTLSQREIARYILSGESMDKAGAYGIQGLGARLVKRVDGCFYNVVGLPVAHTINICDNIIGVEDGIG